MTDPADDSDAVDREDEGMPRRPRGVYLLPNLFTTGALFAGFYAIVAAINDQFEAAAIAVFFAMILDGVDGRVARLTHTESEFGVQYDSLSDMVSFGVAPALVMYEWALHDMANLGWAPAKLGWLVAFTYAACGALRLARFNTQTGSADKRFFIGLPSPSAAAVTMGLVWFGDDLGVPGNNMLWVSLFITLAAGLLMVSNIRYRSFKDLDVRDRMPFVAALAVLAIFVLFSLDPPKVLFAVFFLYAMSGPVQAFLRRRRRAPA